jgi:hypothetical protein
MAALRFCLWKHLAGTYQYMGTDTPRLPCASTFRGLTLPSCLKQRLRVADWNEHDSYRYPYGYTPSYTGTAPKPRTHYQGTRRTWEVFPDPEFRRVRRIISTGCISTPGGTGPTGPTGGGHPTPTPSITTAAHVLRTSRHPAYTASERLERGSGGRCVPSASTAG